MPPSKNTGSPKSSIATGSNSAWSNFLVKLLGDYGWHTHGYSDKVLFAVEGDMAVDFADGGSMTIREGEMAVVPKSVSHRPRSENGCSVVLIELSDPFEAV